MRYIATIKWLDNGDIEDNKIFKIGKITEDHKYDNEIFFYLDDESEIDDYSRGGCNYGYEEWVILSIEKENNK